MFIVLEGLDGAGTTTQCSMLVSWLRANGRSALSTREPSDGPVGVLIRQMLGRRVVGRDGEAIDRETLALLFAADRIDHVRNEVEPALEKRQWVVSDRYYHSSFAYQGDVDDADHFDFAWVRELNARARTPDVTVFLDTPVDVCVDRLGDRGHRDIYETRDKLERLATRYEEVIATLRKAGEKIVVVDGTRSIAGVHASIVATVDPLGV